MRFVYPDIDCVFDTEQDKINTIVIENQPLFCSLITDIKNQSEGFEGRAILSQDEKILRFDKKAELLDRIIPFDMNTRALLSKITQEMEKQAISDEFSARTCELLNNTERLLTDLAFDYPCGIEFSKLDIASIIKASGAVICNDYDSLGEKIIDYFQLVNELIDRKLFFTVNLRSYLNDTETGFFMQTLASRRFDVIMIESFGHTRLKEEKRLIVDADLCLIG